MAARGLVVQRLGRRSYKANAAGSNPAEPTSLRSALARGSILHEKPKAEGPRPECVRVPEKIRFDVGRREAQALLSALARALHEAPRAEPWTREAEHFRAYLEQRMRERRFL